MDIDIYSRIKVTTTGAESIWKKLYISGFITYIESNIVITNAFPTDIEELFICVRKIPGSLFVKVQNEIVEIRSIV